MRQLERCGRFSSDKLTPGDRDDPESYKTRRGKVGGYLDYFGSVDIDYLNRRLGTELHHYYGYDFRTTNI
jgi:hypothetical protein